MDSELEELESLVSDHFGRTPLTTPCASQEADRSSDESDQEIYDDSGEEIDRATIQSAVDCRVSDFLDQIVVYESELSGDETTECESDEDLIKVKELVNTGCGCKRKCCQFVSVDTAYQHILSIREMNKEEKELFIMGSLAFTADSETTQRGKRRKRSIMQYRFAGRVVCRKVFAHLYDIGLLALDSIVRHFKKEGAKSRRHGNCQRKPKHAITYEDVKRIVEFIQNFADEHGLPQPAAPRGRDNLPLIYLQSGLTKLQLHKDYVNICEQASVRSVKQSCFCEIWNNCLPHIKIASPREDVCGTCEKHRRNIQAAVEENEKIQAATDFRNHVTLAQKERDLYNTCIKRAKETNRLDPDERFNHYTFDFSQNVSLPHFSRQMGPLYFTVLRKVHIFGVRIDGIPKQLNFMIDEAETIGQDGSQSHGPNAVISMLDHVLDNYGGDEPCISLHADNCPGQNKNRFMIGYLMWRVMGGKQTVIEFMMQIPGHAKCLVDSGFGLLKKLYKRSNIETMDELEQAVGKSAISNVAVRYPAWKWRDWKSFLKPIFKPIPRISKCQYFRVSRDDPGWVTVREGSDQLERRVKVAEFDRHTDALPEEIKPAGLSADRSRYLYKTVRPYLSFAVRDAAYPLCDP